MILASCLQSKISRNAWVRGRLRRERVTRGEKRSKSAILRVRQTNGLCAGVFRSLLLFLYFRPVVISLGIIFWLALTLCQYHHPRWRQSSTNICLLCRLQLSLAGYYKHLRETGSKIADTAYLEGTGYFIFRIA